MRTVLIGAVVGAVLGIGSWLVVGSSPLLLVPWAVVGLVLGAVASRRAVLAGAAYGYLLSFTYLAVGYDGEDATITKVPGFALLAIFGAVCGAALAWAGHRVRPRRSV
jgi:hypothetical protein